MSCHRLTTLIPSLEYGKLKSSAIIPKTVMFNKIPKFGGNMPKLARKTDPWWFGLYMDRLIRIVLQSGFDPDCLESALVETIKVTGESQCTNN